MKKRNKIIEAIIIFLLIWVGGSVISMMLNINNGLLPSLFLGAGIAIWRYKSWNNNQ